MLYLMKTSTKRVKIAITLRLVHEKLTPFVLAADLAVEVTAVVVEIAVALGEGWLRVLFESTIDLLFKDALAVGSERMDGPLGLERLSVDVGSESEPP